ncbi:ELM1/GtrOC1 family putative glycosyltransferase [Mongoliimonas terrestris]|uniref:ELM1/GtrOC1 family putative glycosyltransferase n=1 Tax=Mongoliimonas terrestris TaxID=1709001 RepID=UPI00094956FB|nr:ELM1/GtrOC1 family putative glycosyltransferase [Mongoliimonas terrestris]
MRVLLLRDKKPGHYHQVEAVGRMLAGMGAAVDRVDIRPVWFGHGDILKLAVNRLPISPRGLLERLYRLDPDRLQGPDLVVGSGRPTIAAGVFLKQVTGARFVYIGRISGYRTAHVDRQLVQNPREAHDRGCVLSPLPSLVRRDDLPLPRRLLAPADLSGATLGLLVGGPAHGHVFEDADWHDLERLVRGLAALGVRWQATASRRTPAVAAARLARLAAEGVVAHFIDPRVSGPGTAGPLFAADALVVAEDSQSMIAEGLAAGRPVVALKPRLVASSSANEVIASWVVAGGLSVVPLSADVGHLAAVLTSTGIAPDPQPVLRRILSEMLADFALTP